ncbi:hypothetical protein F3Y22_tig00109936pilonHSYRG00123 [Hibiscus syriacus]|uniref:J domain-containing protein n=1 Tax=Hibiscus syriacus TaxID=106335 RepID=A0A6A3BSP8_HIBSY|nr:hypothetical protein F3Y22_tig00109936pilonHSYRG00123 [Hibiscus syriacus]
MIATLDVYISAENKINGEADWYGILDVNPLADDEAVKQYRKLALMLHPDKNKSIGAEGAFKLISEAWSLLLQKRQMGFYNAAKTSTSSVKTSKSSKPHGGRSSALLSARQILLVQWGPFSRTGGTSTAAQAASVVQQAYEKVRRAGEAQAATKREEAMRKKHHGSKRAGGASSGYTNAAKRRKGMEDVLETGINGSNKYNNTRAMSQLETQSMLIYKAKREIQKKLNEWNSSPVDKTTSKDVRGNENAMRKRTNLCSGVGLDAETLEAMSINVPDPDFHDFDKDRTERSFESNQIHSRLGSAGLIQKLTVNSVHLTGWTKGMGGAICLYPRKEVLDDYNEELGVTIIPLVRLLVSRRSFTGILITKKSGGFLEKRCLFLSSSSFILAYWSRSSQAPKGCRELDPAATPVELRQVLDVKDEEILENDYMDWQYNWVEWMSRIGHRMLYYVGFLPFDDLQVDEIQRVAEHSFGGFLFNVKAHFGASSAKWNFSGF